MSSALSRTSDCDNLIVAIPAAESMSYWAEVVGRETFPSGIGLPSRYFSHVSTSGGGNAMDEYSGGCGLVVALGVG